VSLLVCAVRDLNGAEENPELDALVDDLRSYLKCLVQDYCKKNASFLARPPSKMDYMMPQITGPPPPFAKEYREEAGFNHYGPPGTMATMPEGLNLASSIYVNIEAGEQPHNDEIMYGRRVGSLKKVLLCPFAGVCSYPALSWMKNNFAYC
jgi:hypothetical protein